MKVILFILLLRFSLIDYAQENSNSTKTIHLGTGPAHVSLQDKVFSPLVYRGTGVSIDLGFCDKKNRRKHYVHANILTQQLSPSLNEASTTTIQNTHLSMDYEYAILLKEKKWKYHLGGGFYNFLSVRNIQFTIGDEVGLDWFSSVNMLFLGSRIFNQKHIVSFVMSSSLFSYVIGRMKVPRYLPQDVIQSLANDPDRFPVGRLLRAGDFLTLMDFFDIRTSFSYLLRVSEAWGIGFTYHFRYYQYPKFMDVQYGLSQYHFILAYQF
ncbi:MAG: hypothetical protein AAF600_03100 [Bacteroidota bacterium]